MASEGFNFPQKLNEAYKRYTEVIDGRVEPDRIPYSAAAYPVMEMHKSLSEHTTRQDQATKQSGFDYEINVMVIVPGGESESQSSDLQSAICAELQKQEEMGYQCAPTTGFAL